MEPLEAYREATNGRLYEALFMTTPYLLAIDQGTTSTRAVVYDAQGQICGSASRELTQHYPRPGWVEHDAEEIWTSVAEVVPRALAAAAIEGSQLTALGLTNQRETVVLWERDSGRPVARAVVWQDRRTSDFCQTHQAEEPWLRERTGLVLDPYFSASKIGWLLDHVAGAREAAQAGRRAFGTVDVLINNASELGPSPMPALEELDWRDFLRVLRVNVAGPLHLAQLVIPGMRARGEGVIINVSSDAGVNAYPGWGGYGASKAALEHLSRTLAAELDGSGIRVYVVDPGDMNTRMHRDAEPGPATHIFFICVVADGTHLCLRNAETVRHHDPAGPEATATHAEYTVLDAAGRLQLPKEMTEPLGMRDLVRLESEPDHIGVWPDRRSSAPEEAQ